MNYYGRFLGGYLKEKRIISDHNNNKKVEIS